MGVGWWSVDAVKKALLTHTLSTHPPPPKKSVAAGIKQGPVGQWVQRGWTEPAARYMLAPPISPDDIPGRVLEAIQKCVSYLWGGGYDYGGGGERESAPRGPPFHEPHSKPNPTHPQTHTKHSRLPPSWSPLTVVAVLAFLPIFEARVAVPFGLALGALPLPLLFFCFGLARGIRKSLFHPFHPPFLNPLDPFT